MGCGLRALLRVRRVPALSEHALGSHVAACAFSLRMLLARTWPRPRHCARSVPHWASLARPGAPGAAAPGLCAGSCAERLGRFPAEGACTGPAPPWRRTAGRRPPAAREPVRKLEGPGDPAPAAACALPPTPRAWPGGPPRFPPAARAPPPGRPSAARPDAERAPAPRVPWKTRGSDSAARRGARPPPPAARFSAGPRGWFPHLRKTRCDVGGRRRRGTGGSGPAAPETPEQSPPLARVPVIL